MKRWILALAPLFGAMPARAASPGDSDPVLRALHDEIGRSMNSLALPGAPKPYYVSYRLDDSNDLRISAAFGALLEDEHARHRTLHAVVRVGDYAVDSSNFAAGEPFSQWRELAPTFVPLEGDYEAVRRAAWLVTDRRYKAAVGSLEKKTALHASQQAAPDRVDDFSHEPSSIQIDTTAPAPAPDSSRYRSLARALAGIGRDHGDVQSSTARLMASQVRRSFESSEGSTSVEVQSGFHVDLVLRTQADDGMVLSDFMSTTVCSPKGIPPDASLVSEAQRMAGELEEIRRAPVADDYTGPVLFEGAAAPQLVRSVLRGALDGTPPPESADERFQAKQSELAGKVGQRILPPGFSLVDDPSIDEVSALPLAGCYRFDDEGVPAQRVVVAEDGAFRSFLMSRTPRKGFPKSNGHAQDSFRGTPSGHLGNLLLSVKNGLTDKELRRRLIAEANATKHPYAVVVSLLDDGTTSVDDGGRRPWETADRGTPALVMWKVTPDGKAERIRGGRVAEVPLRALKEIVAAGKAPAVSSTINYGGSDSVVAPALLFKELEILKPRAPSSKAPVAARPDLVAK